MSHRSFLRGCSAGAATLFVVGTAAAPCLAQQMSDQPSYVEVSWMKMKQDKVGEFAQLATRLADANRRGKGDNYVAYMDFYGHDNFVTIGSMRPSLSDIEPGMGKFMGAIKEMMGYSPERLFAEAGKTVESSGTELRVRRPDLSWNVKDDTDWMARMAKAQYLAVVCIRVKPGHTLDAEKQITMLREAGASHEDSHPAGVTQLMFGGEPGTFYITIPLEAVGDIAKIGSPRKLLGEDGYHAYSEMAAQNYASVDYSLKRAVPEWSNPPASYLEANPKLWKVKAAVMAKPKPATADTKPAATTGGR